MENGFTIIYKCNRCGNLSQELKLYCDSCGSRLIMKPVLKAMFPQENKGFVGGLE